MAARKSADPKQTKEIVITPPNFKVLEVDIIGTAQYVSNAGEFEAMKAAQELGDAGKDTKRRRPPKDFEAGYQASMHRDMNGKVGYIPAGAFRAAMIRAGYNFGVDMTLSKCTIFVLADANSVAGTGLVRITKG